MKAGTALPRTPKAYELSAPFLTRLASWEATVTHRFGMGYLQRVMTTEIDLRFIASRDDFYALAHTHEGMGSTVMGVGADYFKAFMSELRIDQRDFQFDGAMKGSMSIKCCYLPPAPIPRRLMKKAAKQPIAKTKPTWKLARHTIGVTA